MAFDLIWSLVAQEDLKRIVAYIRHHNPTGARSFAQLLVDRTELLVDFPELGRVVPEREDPQIRELIVRNYRIVYRLYPDRKALEIIRVWHSARGEQEFEGAE